MSKIDLNVAVKEINEILESKRLEYNLTFEEEGHIYHMLNDKGELKNDFPSVSSVIEEFFKPFDAESKSLEMCYGDVDDQKKLLAEWNAKGLYATGKGSRVHYELEKYALLKAKNPKKVRKPFFECDSQQMIDSDMMIKAGEEFVNLMFKRGCVLLETEGVLGSILLGYVGQCDNFWLSLNKTGDKIMLVTTDYKTNKVKNLEPQPYNDYMYKPFDKWVSYALTHYHLQLPLYSRLFFDMLKGSKYEGLELGGCIVVSMRDNGSFVEYRVPKEFEDKILTMDLKPFIKKKKKSVETNYE